MRYDDFTHCLAAPERSGVAGVAYRTMAVFADGNHQRLGINRAAASLGPRLPDDVSVVGFGDLPFVDW